MTTAPFQFESSGRNQRTLATVAGVWALLGAAYVYLEAAAWVLGIFALFTLPALWDLIANTRAGLEIDSKQLRWYSGRQDVALNFDQIRAARFDTRLDFSVRVTLQLVSGQRLRIPFEATPPHEAFEAELQARGLPVERHHFSLLG